MRILRDPDPPQNPGGNPPPPVNPAPSAPPAPPPAAEVVINGERSERELQLEAELERERSGRKKDQTKLCELEDENHRLKQVPATPARGRNKSAGPISTFFGWED
ncbi:MAG: hypothetical protein KGL39_26000 [Patescibacteria group bacterium]|nr:hypothetical protein [Patescibacteria group bacterium]